jgi:pentatricopeptide repeat protein
LLVAAVCKSVGNTEKAYSTFLEMRDSGMQLEARVYGALIASFAEAMKRELNVVHKRKEQFLLLQQAQDILMHADKQGIILNEVPWNAMLVAAGRCKELSKARDLFQYMQSRPGVQIDQFSFGALIEAHAQCKQPEEALKYFYGAMAQVRACVCVY